MATLQRNIHRSVKVGRFLASDPVRTARLGQSPHSVIARAHRTAVRYFPAPEPRHRPVFACMPLINTWSIWDLIPERSVVARLTEAGVPVYLLDWGTPGPEDAEVPLSTYVDDLLGRALRASARHCGSELDAVGYCVGGTFLAMHLARHTDAAVRRMALVASPIDFHRSGRLSTWARPEHFPVDAIVAGPRNFDAWRMKGSFAWLQPSGRAKSVRALHERIDTDGFPELWAALERWSADAVDFPGTAYREYVRRCYFDNALIGGGWTLGTEPVDLSRGTLPALALAASTDHIAEPPSCLALADAWGGPVETRVLKGGHVGISVGRALPEALLAWVRS